MKTHTNSLLQFFIKIVLPSLLALILFILTLFYIVIPEFEQAMMDRKREMIRELTNSASSILEKYHKDEQEGILTREEAQQTAISRIQYLRYGDENKDYFWITDMHPTMVIHPYKPELNGSDLTNYEDPHGKKMFVEFVSVVSRDGHGFVEYMWQWKDDSTHIVPKLSYVKKFEPWNWIIGTGIYIEDVRKEISALTARLTYISIIISALTLILLTFISIQSFRIERKRQKAENNLKESREKYRTLVEASTEGLLMISDNEIIFSNTVFQEMTALSYEDISGMSWKQLFHLPADLQEKMEQNSNDVEALPFETAMSLPGGRELQVLVTITPIIFYGKKAVIFSVKDISSDLQIKRQLFESRERFKTLMDKLNVGIFRTTIDARGRFLEANETALKLLGFDQHEQLRDMYIIDLLAETDDKRNFRKRLLETGFIKNQVIKLIRRDETTSNMMVSLAVITDEDGQPAWCDGIIEPVITRHSDEKTTGAIESIEEIRALLNNMNISGFSEPVQTISPGTTIDKAAEIFAEQEQQYLLVSDNEHRILGYIIQSDIVAALVHSPHPAGTQVYTIMKSPLPVTDVNCSVLQARTLLKRTGSSILLMTKENGDPAGVITHTALMNADETRLFSILADIGKATSVSSLRKLNSEFTDFMARLTMSNTPPGLVLGLLSAAFDETNKRLFEIAFNEIGPPPAEFAYIVLGSEGRQEQTLSTDQDNAIIFDDSADDEAKAYFLKLGQIVCESLNTIGYSLCKGGNMAMNPKWNQPLGTWKKNFSNWINTGHAKDLLDINIFFDFRLCVGSESLVNDLQQHISAVSAVNPAYLHLMARNTAQNKLSFAEMLNLKESISTFVNFIRIYALQNNIPAKNTLQRMHLLTEAGILKENSTAETEKALEFLMSFRLKHQASQILRKIQADNTIETRNLTDFEQTILKKAIATISTALTRLNYDFRLSI